MLRFFRKIRQQLLGEGSIRKYLIYAIGEILLVMIGILLALQVSIWNQNVIKKQKEIKLLKELRLSLEASDRHFQSTLKESKKILKAKELVIDFFENDQVWEDSLQQYFNQFFLLQDYNIDETAFRSLESWGIDKLSNDTLREQISHLYNNRSEHLSNLEKNEMEMWWGGYHNDVTTLFDFGAPKMKPYDDANSIQIENYVKKEKLFKTIIAYNNNRYSSIQRSIQRLEKHTAIEIERLSN